VALTIGAVALILAALVFGWYRSRRSVSEQTTQATERQLTANPPEDAVNAAAISPDGKYVAYTDATSLLVRSVDSGEIRAISLPADFPATQIWQIRWFPEGEKLLVTQLPGFSGGASIWSVAVIGEASPKRLRENATSPEISPDGRSMVFVTDKMEGPDEIWVSGLGGEGARKLVVTGEDLESPIWSPDSQWIAYLRFSRKRLGTSIEIQAISSSASKSVVTESSLPAPGGFSCGPGGCMCWLPDWRFVFAESERPNRASGTRKTSLWQVPIDPKTGAPTEKAQKFAEWPDFASWNMTATTDGKTLALTKTRINMDVYVGELEQENSIMKTPRRLTLDIHNSMPDGWTRDSRSVLFGSDRNGKWELFRQGLNESVPEKIVSSTTNDIGSDSEVSPDGSWILFWQSAEPSGTEMQSAEHLMRQPLAGGPPEKVIEVPIAESRGFRFYCAEKSGAPCVLSSREANELTFFLLDPVRGKGDELGKIEIDGESERGWELSPDGSQLASVDYSHKGKIEILDVAKHAWHEIAVEPGSGDFQSVAWAANGKGFFITSWTPNMFEVIHVSLTGKVQVLRKSHGRWVTRPRPSPDGKYLAYQGQTWDSNVWLLDKF
jgi:Tol biopolymer transport system component